MTEEFRLLTADEIDCRVQKVKANGCSLLLYKNARVDQTILDETFGMFNWKRSHQLIGDRLYCTVSVKDPESGEWVSKQDVGVESNSEPEKGQASDSFKRACFNWGIGRELYSAPFIWIPEGRVNIEKNQAGSPTTYDRFKVREISYRERKITGLVISNESMKGTIVYNFGEHDAPPLISMKGKPAVFNIGEHTSSAKVVNAPVTKEQAMDVRIQLAKKGVPEEQACSHYGKQKLDELTRSEIIDLCKHSASEMKGWPYEAEGNTAEHTA